MQKEIIIIGAGLTGLTAAYFLHLQGHRPLILEARDRVGGRIHTARVKDGAPVEMGATWLGSKHTELVSLLEKLGLKTFEQVTGGRAIYEAISTSPPQVVQLPHNDQPSYRIAGGSNALIDALVSKLPEGTVKHSTQVTSVIAGPEKVEVLTDNGRYTASRIVSTLPPNLLINSVVFEPALPPDFVAVAANTHTWMGESIKVGLRYSKPFWRENGQPGGTIFSNVGPVSEMYDHTNVEEDLFALKGFLNGSYFSLSGEERRDMVLNQLRKYFGEVVDTYTAYEEAVWRNDPFTFIPNVDHVLPHQHNGHPVFRQEFLDGKLIVAGSETAVLYPGYMDGAVRSGKRVANLIGQAT